MIDIDKAFEGYLVTALWSSVDYNNDEPLDSNFDIDDISEDTRAAMLVDFRLFCETVNSLLDLAPGRLCDYLDDSRLGHDFWLTRNRHGAGFWDGDWGSLGDILTKISEKFGEIDLYVGDDGKLYI